MTVTAKTTRNTKNADRFEALHILRSIAALTARKKTGTRAADEKRAPGGTGWEQKIWLRPAPLGLFERKESVHPFPSKHRGAGRASTQLLTMVCVGSVSLEFVLTKSDSDSENNAQHEKC